MIADAADIRFECRKCGQHLVVEAAGAGLTADCPICNTSVTVPRPGSAGRKERDPLESRSRGGLTTTATTDSSRPAFADPTPDDLREELIDASLINGKLVRDLQKAREEVTKLQQQLKAVSDECEHLNASSTHTQAELKTFQSERQQSKAELATLRQKFTAAEEALAARDAELKDAQAKLAASVPSARLESAETDLAEARRLITEWESKATAAQKAHDDASRSAAEWESKATAAQKAHEDASRSADEWKSKSEMVQTSLAEAAKLLALRDAEVKTAAEQAQKLAAENESKTADLNRALADERRALSEERTQRELLAKDLAAKLAELGDARAQFSGADGELHNFRGRLGELEASLSSAQENVRRLGAERDDLQRDLGEARAQLAEAGDLKSLLARSGDELRAQSEKLQLAEETVQTLTTRCDQLRREGDTLRCEVNESHSGRELVEIRERLDETTEERDRIAARLSAVEADLQAFTATEKATRIEIEQARAERDDALERVESLRETRAAKDNQILRGIIARLNADLSQRSLEVARLKRGRYGLKIAYIVFAIGFLAVVAFAILILPQALKQ